MNKIIGIFIFGFIVENLLGCSYLEKLFPDKERDYQYTTEIPMLNWPPELQKNQQTNGIAAASDAANSNDAATGTSSESSPPESATVPNPSANSTPVEVRTSEADDFAAITSVKVIQYDDGDSRLRLGTGFEKAWRVVSKALSRNSIEVTERNHDQRQFSLQYDPDEKQAKDESFLDEINFFFKGINTNDQKYLLKLEENTQGTDVLVLNEEHQPILKSDAVSRLLKLLADTINADLSKQTKQPSDTTENGK